ncbi:MAG: hypothetical protein JW703_05325 [Candidatus Diapherotrites archaeon]|nr:hypothetical protein [Candidatus Diapherotrites archaeon]
MNLYLKAAIITLFIFLIGMFLVQQMDLMRFNSLQDKVESEVMEVNETKLLFLFTQIFDDASPEMCLLLEKRIDLQAEKTYSMVLELEESKNNSLLINYDLLKKKYFLKNAELFLYLKQAEKLCTETKTKPILYFYPDKSDCPDCFVQAKILDKIRDECNARIFAFPTDLDIEIISLIKAEYNVNEAPSLVVNNESFDGIQSEEKLKELIQCN